jgi:CRISPR-associated protein Cas2
MHIVVSYDIPDDKRRTKVMKILKDFGKHVQYSVFECQLKQQDYARLRERLKQVFNPQQDNIRFYLINQEDWRKRQVWGDERVEVELKSWYMVGMRREGRGVGKG